MSVSSGIAARRSPSLAAIPAASTSPRKGEISRRPRSSSSASTAPGRSSSARAVSSRWASPSNAATEPMALRRSSAAAAAPPPLPQGLERRPKLLLSDGAGAVAEGAMRSERPDDSAAGPTALPPTCGKALKAEPCAEATEATEEERPWRNAPLWAPCVNTDSISGVLSCSRTTSVCKRPTSARSSETQWRSSLAAFSAASRSAHAVWAFCCPARAMYSSWPRSLRSRASSACWSYTQRRKSFA
mmetsp:Transcript_49270/g.141678  ORF Transcript_49270/g.141678 Transcript_49270/m.141678 type:complete len:244 (+) Transcript_49270:1260-1991(+)